jgi:hypothetical protein
MLRTCGITTKEMKGKGAHDLAALVGKLRAPESDPCPASNEQLSALSSAYLLARYLPFPLVGNALLQPAGRYGKADAESARDILASLLAWARRVYRLGVLRSNTRTLREEWEDDGDILEEVDFRLPAQAPIVAQPAYKVEVPVQPAISNQQQSEPIPNAAIGFINLGPPPAITGPSSASQPSGTT